MRAFAVMMRERAGHRLNSWMRAVRRDALSELRDGSWREAVAWAWSWNASGRPVQWRCQVEVGGNVA